MFIELNGQKPNIHKSAYIAPNAVVSGDVIIEEDVRVLFGAIISAEGSQIVIKKGTIIMENAVMRSVPSNKLIIGKHVLIGPHAYLTGCSIGNQAFLAAGAKVYNGAEIGAGSIIAIGGIVHVNTILAENSRIPIYHVAIGNPPNVYAANQAKEVQSQLNILDFLGTVFHVSSNPDLPTRIEAAVSKYGEFLGKYNDQLKQLD